MNSRQRKRIQNRKNKIIYNINNIIDSNSVPNHIKSKYFYISVLGTLTYKNEDGSSKTEEKEFILF
jgi:hypothetical protein